MLYQHMPCYEPLLHYEHFNVHMWPQPKILQQMYFITLYKKKELCVR